MTIKNSSKLSKFNLFLRVFFLKIQTKTSNYNYKLATIKSFLKENLYFLIPYFAISSFLIIIIFSTSKAELHIFCNGFHNMFFDFFFKYVTFLGDGIVIPILIVGLLFIKLRYAIIAFAGSISAVTVTNLIKRYAFEVNPRPKLFFEKFSEISYNLYIVPGTNPTNYLSFPSGHTTSAFACFFALALFSKNKYFKLFMLILAFLTAYSRVYLSFHFMEDITAGAFIGTFFTGLSFILFGKIKSDRLEKRIKFIK